MGREYILPNEDKDLISLTDLAKKLDVDKSTIQNWVRKKGFPKPKGYMWLYGAFYLKDEVNEWLKLKPAMDKKGFSQRGRKKQNANGEQK